MSEQENNLDLNIDDAALENEGDTLQNEGDAIENEGNTPIDDGLEISLGEENEDDKEEKELDGKAPDWVRNLRKTTKEQQKRIKELEQEVAKRNTPQSQDDELLPPKPNMHDDGIDYDQDAYDEAMIAWLDKKKAIESRKKEAEKAQETIQREWDEQVQNYEKRKADLKSKVKDFDDADDVYKSTLSVVQQAIVVKGAANPEHIAYALGKNPSKAKELAAITDPIRFAFAIANLEKVITVKKREAPKPETSVKSGAASSSAVESQLERLREQAIKTGDMSPLLAFKRKNGIK